MRHKGVIAALDKTPARWQASVMDEVTEIDARGLICPLPVLRAAKMLRGMAQGAVLRVLADDPIAIIDIPNFCREAGHDLLSQSDEGAHQTYLIRRG